MAGDDVTKVQGPEVSNSDSESPILPGSLTNTPISEIIGLRYRDVQCTTAPSRSRRGQGSSRTSGRASQLKEGAQGPSVGRASQALEHKRDGNPRDKSGTGSQQTAGGRSQSQVQRVVPGEPESLAGSESEGGPEWLHSQILSSESNTSRGGGYSDATRGVQQGYEFFHGQHEEARGGSNSYPHKKTKN